MKNTIARLAVISAAFLTPFAAQDAVAGVVVPPIKAEPNNAALATGSQSNSVIQWKQAIATPPESRISDRTRSAMQKALVTAWQAGRLQSLPPIAGSNGEILYAYGNSLPTLVTAPMHTSIIILKPGCIPGKATGIPASEWVVHPVMAGNQPELTLMPKFAGLHTDVVIPATSASGKPLNYVIQITSDSDHYTPSLGFYYPGSDIVRWQQADQARDTAREKAKAMTVAALPSLSVSDLNFGWKIHCGGGGWFSDSDCHDIAPARVFSSRDHTYLQFRANQSAHGGIPAIMAENSAGKPAIVNAQYRDGYYIVDSVPREILLIAGKNSDKRVVKIVRED